MFIIISHESLTKFAFDCRLHNPYLFLRQPVELVDQGVDLFIGGLDLPFEQGFLMIGLHPTELFVEIKHPLDHGNHRITAGLVDGVRGVDCAYGELG